MRANAYIMPNSIEEAYHEYINTKNAVLLAGGLFVRLQKKEMPLLIDLKNLGLSYIKDEDMISIGAMTDLRTIEKSTVLPKGLIESVKQISGVGTRNLATVGGSVCGRYPFSDIDTALVALDAILIFHHHGEITMREYYAKGLKEKDLLIEIKVPKVQYSRSLFFKKVYTDFSLVNVSISNHSVAVGARPQRAVVIEEVDYSLSTQEILKNINFGSDFKASGDYRRALAESLLEDAIKEMGGHCGN